jgi:hypothetical protein
MKISDMFLKFVDSIKPGVTVRIITEILFLIVMNFTDVLRQSITSSKSSATVRIFALERAVARMLSHMVANFVFIKKLFVATWPFALMWLIASMTRFDVILEQFVCLELPRTARPFAYVRLFGRVD